MNLCEDCGVNWATPDTEFVNGVLLIDETEFCDECKSHHANERFRVVITIADGHMRGKPGYVLSKFGSYSTTKPLPVNTYTREEAQAIADAIRLRNPSVRIEMC